MMTLDSSIFCLSPTKNDLHDTKETGRNLPPKVRISKGIYLSEPKQKNGPGIEEHAFSELRETTSNTNGIPTWSYLFVHNRKVDFFATRMRRDGLTCFIHRSIVYERKKHTRGIQAIEKPSVSGLIFLQGHPDDLQRYLDTEFPPYHLVNNCSTHLPAVIPDSQMQPFMRVSETDPNRIRILLQPFRHYADGNTKLRITSGFLAGLEGYVVRIDRDRRLVMDVGGMSIAISGVHCEKFEVVEDFSK